MKNDFLDIGRWKIEYDRSLTDHCFKQLPVGNCDCSECLNFLAAIEYAFPEPFISLANTLGIDIRKYTELCHHMREESGLYYVGGWFHFVGRIHSGSDCWREGVPAFEDLLGIEMGFTNRIALAIEPFTVHPLVQLEFATHVPWVIDETN